MTDYRTENDGRIVEVRKSSSPIGWLLALLVVVALVAAAFSFGFINIDRVSDGKAPTVKLETSAGEAPKFNVQTGTIELGQQEKTVKVPTVDVGSTDTRVTVPTISVQRADDPGANK